jgi:hypothetical protein
MKPAADLNQKTPTYLTTKINSSHEFVQVILLSLLPTYKLHIIMV